MASRALEIPKRAVLNPDAAPIRGGVHMIMVAVDWAGPRGVFATWDGGEEVEHFADLTELLDLLDQPHMIVLEPAFESFLPDRRDAFILRARAEDHDLRRISDRMTPRMRRSLGFPEKGKHGTSAAQKRADDEYDTRAIWHLAQRGRHLSPVHRVCEIGEGWQERSAALNREAVVIRFSGDRSSCL